jgi:hypothetical protein
MLTKENEKAIYELLDVLTPFSGLLEFGTDLAIPLGVSQLDKRVLDKINIQYHPIINEIISAILIQKDYELAKQKTAELLTQLIDTPLIDGTPDELIAYDGLLDFLQIVIEGLLNKSKKENVA